MFTLDVIVDGNLSGVNVDMDQSLPNMIEHFVDGRLELEAPYIEQLHDPACFADPYFIDGDP